MATSFPIFIVPGVSMALFDKMGLIPKARIPKTILELSVIAFALWIALPLSVSIYPQQGEMTAAQLEEEFRGKRTANGRVVEKYFYNRGL
jgi:hypothetical protein